MKKLISLTLRISILIIPILMLIYAPQAHAASNWLGTKCVGTDMQTGGADPAKGGDVATIQGFGCLIANVLSIALTGLGLIGFVMFIVGGFMYMLSGGNAKGTETAKNTVTYSIIGIVVALSAFIILNLIASFTGVQGILKFTIPDDTTTLQNSPGS